MEAGCLACRLTDALCRGAAREIALQPPEGTVSGEHPPGVFSALPRLLERYRNGRKTVLPHLYTVLVEGDDYR